MAVSGSGEIKLRDIYNEQQEASGVPADDTNISMDSLADNYGANAASTVTARSTLSADQDNISHFYGAVYPGTFYQYLLYRGSFGSNALDGVAANDDNSVIVEGETVVPYAASTQDLEGTDNATFEIVTTAGSSLNPVQSDDSNESGTNTFPYASIVLSPENGTYDGGDMKFKVTDTNNSYNSNFGNLNFRFYDNINGHTTSQIGPSGNTSATKIMYVDAADESVGDIVTVHSTTVGNIRSSSYSRAINENGDGGNIYHTEDLEGVFIIGNTPGKMTFSYTHWQYPYNSNSSSPGTRNKSTNTAVLDIRYNDAIDSLAIDDTTINVSSVDGADNATLTCFSEGYSGTLTIGYDTNNNASDTIYTNTTEAVNTLYVRESISKDFTISSAGTYYVKAHHGGNATVGSSFIVAPAFTYSTTGNQTINVNQTRNFVVTASAGNNASWSITSSPNIGSGTTSATMTPLLKTGNYTITYTATADYGQNNNQTDTLSVDPTLSVALTDNQTGNNYPIYDAHGDTITTGTHGVSPTVFTHTPTAAGTLQNGNALTYAWSAASSNFTYTSGNVGTAGAVSFKKNSSGTLSHSLTVTGDDDRTATDSSSVVCQSVTKAISNATTSDVLRVGTTFTVENILATYTQTIQLFRNQNGGEVIGNGVSAAGTIHFTLNSDALPDALARAVSLRDDDNTDITDGLGNFIIYNALPVIDTFTATASTTIGRIDLAWTTTNATTVSINQSVGSQGSMDGSTYKTGIANNTSMTFTLTAGNANGETVTATATATTLNPTITLGLPDDSSWTWGDTGNVTLVAQKNFANAITGHMGYSLTSANGTSGTELQTILAGNGTVNTNFNMVFDKNDWNYQTSLGSAIVDFRAGHNDALWVVQNNVATVSDFSTPNDATNLSATGTSATAILVNWDDPSGTYTGVKVFGAPEGIGASELTDIDAGQASQYSHTGLNDYQPYVYYIQAYYSRTANGVTRTHANNSSTFQGNVIGWTSVTVYGSVMLANQGTGWSDSGVSSGQEDAYNQPSAATRTLYHLTSEVLGTHTVSMRRTEDGAVYNGNNTWFSTGETPDVFYMDTNGNVTAANYIAGANAKPDAPADGTATANSSTQITLGWSCGSSIEDSFKVFRSTSSYPSTSGTLIATTAANATSYVDSGLSGSTQYYYSIYSFNGTTYSSVRATATATTPASTSWGTAPTDFTISGLPFQTVTSAAKSITITGADTGTDDTTVSCTSGMTVALSLSSSTGYTSYATSKNFTIPNASDTLYAKFRFTFNKAGSSPASSDVTYSNGGVDNTDLDITISEIAI